MTIDEQIHKIRTKGMLDAMDYWPDNEEECAVSDDDIRAELDRSGTLAGEVSDARQWCDPSIDPAAEYLRGYICGVQNLCELQGEYIERHTLRVDGGIYVVGILTDYYGFNVFRHWYGSYNGDGFNDYQRIGRCEPYRVLADVLVRDEIARLHRNRRRQAVEA